MRILSFLVLYLLIFANTSSAAEPNIVKPDSITDLDITATCQACHDRIYDEWSKSMHASSLPSKDPVVAAFYKHLSSKKIDTAKCDRCHSPFKAIYPGEQESRSEIFTEGINCLLCHSVRKKLPEPGRGIDYFQFDFTKGLTGPTEVKQTRYHETEFVPIFRTVEFCSGCHQEGEADYGVRSGKKLQCQYCHMPSRQGQKSAVAAKERDKVFRHFFEGGHSNELLEMTAIVSGEAARVKDRIMLNITIENSASHSIPAGFPLRSIYLKVTGLNKNNEPIWYNYRSNPYSEDPKSFFGLILPVDEELLAHYVKDVKPLKDQRIEPQGTRQLSYQVVTEGITAFKAQLYYRLLPERIVRDFKIDESLAPEVLMAEETIPVK